MANVPPRVAELIETFDRNIDARAFPRFKKRFSCCMSHSQLVKLSAKGRVVQNGFVCNRDH